MNGLLLLDKPSGPTSHDMVKSIRDIYGGVRVGHTGTLDPLASGLLVLLLGRATKFASYIPGDPKVYEGCIMLGVSTDSMDLEGEVLAENNYGGGQEEAEAALASLVGTLEQLPPMYSAVKYKGQPLYRYARRGEDVPRKSRKVEVYRSEMLAYRAEGGRAEVGFHIECSPGTYVRELASRVGDMLGCGGVLAILRRLASGPFRVEDAVEISLLANRQSQREDIIMSLESGLEGYSRIEVSGEGLQAAQNGAPLNDAMVDLEGEEIVKGEIVAVFGGKKFLGMHRVAQASPFRSHALRMM
ncbi:MAG: tRNA pseudouridine(55) synthase TruB [Actinobacteria bacterium]|nr:tRNA pseudouridine(55) synthase TruB [Actinomycetota bacterium]